jgi:phosphoribosylformylglycinamidine (FGAM) synthase PurS component
MISQDLVINPYFSDPQIDYVYKMRMEVYGRFFGGILIIKKLGDQEHRMVLTSEFGSKIFDFSFNKGEFKKNYILEDLDKKILVNTLRDDLQLLVKEQGKVLKQFRIEDLTLFKTDYLNRNGYYYMEASTGRIDEIAYASERKKKMQILFEDIEEDLAKNITIEHYTMKLNMELIYLEQK